MSRKVRDRDGRSARVARSPVLLPWTLPWVLLGAMLAGPLAATQRLWDDGDPANSLWSSPLNWNPDGVPTPHDEAIIDLPGSVCEIPSGVLAVCARCVVGATGNPVQLDLTGGSLDCSGTLSIGVEAGSAVLVNLRSGVITAGRLTIGWNGGEGAIDIQEGTLVLDGDYESLILDYVEAGIITLYAGQGLLHVDYDLTNPGQTTVWTTPRDPRTAWDPEPADQTTVGIGTAGTATLSWCSGTTALSHDIYFGTDYDAVLNAERQSPEYRGNQTSNEFLATDLDQGASYFWRIDEVDAVGVHRGLVWSFNAAWQRTLDGISAEVPVGVFYYPWYGPGAHPTSDSLRYHLVPRHDLAVGHGYDSGDPAVIAAHIRQSVQGNVSFWVCSWWGPHLYEDEVLASAILPHPRAGELKYTVYYESAGRLGDASNPDYTNLLPDFDYLASHYFDDPNWLKIDGRPVVFIYLSYFYFTEEHGYPELEALRAAHPEMFLIGDEIYTDSYPMSRAVKWDAVHVYTCLGSMDASGTTHAAVGRLERSYDAAKSAANRVNTGFAPTVMPGFNDKVVRAGSPLMTRYFIDVPGSHEGDVFVELLREIAVPRLDPIAGGMVLVTSFNEWHEDSSIEATAGTAGVTNRDDSPTHYDYTWGYNYTDYGNLYLTLLRRETTSLQATSLELPSRPQSFR
ncbi:MAG: hypothetical protein AB1486_18035 [Planctomycetota bacterium]